ncbi:MAG: hypothetical protein WC216_07765 [Gallionella sp.]
MNESNTVTPKGGVTILGGFMSKKRIVIQLVAVSAALFFMIFTKVNKNTADMGTAVIGSLIVSIVIFAFFGIVFKEYEIKRQQGKKPSFLSEIKDTDISKYSWVGIGCLGVFLCLTFLGGFVMEESKIIADNLILTGFIFLLLSFVSIIYGAFFAKR